MAVPTVAVTCRAAGQGGPVIPGAIFVARLDRTEVYNGFVAPEITRGVADANGVAVLQLFPNALGSLGSSYHVTFTDPRTEKVVLDTQAVIPNGACFLEDAMLNTLYPIVVPADHVGAGGTAHAVAVPGGYAGFMSGSDKAKLDAIAEGSTANSADAVLLARANHTGEQAISTVTGLQTALDSKAPGSHVGAGGAAHANVIAAGAAGFMTGADKTKLDGVEDGATYNAVASSQDIINCLTDFATIFADWDRFSHGVSGGVDYSDPDEKTNDVWEYDPGDDRIHCLINSDTHIGFVSPESYGDFDFVVEISSTHYDDDRIGVVLAFASGGVEHTLTAHRYLSSPSNSFDVYYDFDKTTALRLGFNDGGNPGHSFANPSFDDIPGLGWDGKTALIRAKREGDIITVWTSALDTTELLDNTKIVIDLNSLAQLATFKASTKLGFSCKSQIDSTWAFLATPWSRNDRYVTPDLFKEGIDISEARQESVMDAKIAAQAAPIAHVGAGGTAHANAVAAGAAGFMTGADKTKLNGIATGATANSSDATLLARANHTGTQAISTVSGLQASLDAKPDITLVSGLIPSAYLPSYVDDVLEYANLAAFPVTGETGKIYVALDTGKIWRWSGSAYVEISASPGTTDSVTEGATNLYFTVARVLAAVLTGLSTATSTAITAADTVLSALGKLQAQITLRAALASPALTGTPTAPTAAVATSTTQIATTAFTQAALGAYGLGVTSAVYSTDLDTTPTMIGFYRTDASTTNAPTTSNYAVVNNRVSANAAMQLASLISSTAPRLYVRSSNLGTYTSWRELALLDSPTFTTALNTTGKISYTTGAGGAVTQATSKSTGVTLNKATGQITLNAASLAAGATAVFTLTNSFIAANDIVKVHRKSGGTAGSYAVDCDAVAAGACDIYIRNTTGGALAEAVVLQFSVLGGVIA